MSECVTGEMAIPAQFMILTGEKPMIRNRNRGEAVFREVSWEEALNYTAGKMLEIKAKHGAE